MSVRIIIPIMNALSFVEIDPAEEGIYISRHMDDYWHRETLNQWQQGSQPYMQPFLLDDSINLQFQSNGGVPNIKVIDCNQQVHINQNMVQKQQNTYEPAYYIYESSTALTSLDPGHYFFKVTVGIRTLISEPIDVQETHANSLLIEYTNRKFYQNIIFETEFSPSVRVLGLLNLKPPASKDTMYEDQVLDMVMIQSKPYRLWDFRLFAIAPFMIDKLNRVFGCSTILIDGKAYTKNEGSKWEAVENVGNGSLREYQIELREAVNKDSKWWDTENEDELNIILNVSSKGFADTFSESGTILQVSNID